VRTLHPVCEESTNLQRTVREAAQIAKQRTIKRRLQWGYAARWVIAQLTREATINDGVRDPGRFGLATI
jgi:hypothetical protein